MAADAEKEKFVNRGGFRFKRSISNATTRKSLPIVSKSLPVLPSIQPIPTDTLDFENGQLPVTVSSHQNVSNTKTKFSSKLKKGSMLQSSITAFAKTNTTEENIGAPTGGPRPIAAVAPHRSPGLGNSQAGFKRKRTPVSVDILLDEDDDDFTDTTIKILSQSQRISPKVASRSKLSRTRAVIEESDEEDNVHQTKRRRAAAIISDDEDDDHKETPDELHSGGDNQWNSNAERKADGRIAQSESTEEDFINHPLLSRSLTKVERCDSEETRHLLLHVMDEVCDIVGQISMSDLMSVTWKNYERLQKLLGARKMIKDKAVEFPVLGSLNFCKPDRKVAPTSYSSAENTESSNHGSCTPSGGFQRLRNVISNKGANYTSTPLANSKPKAPSPPLSRCSASSLSMTKGSPIPCGDSFFEGESPFTQAQVSFVQNLQSASSAQKSRSKKFNFSSRNSGVTPAPLEKDCYDDYLPDISTGPLTPQNQLNFRCNQSVQSNSATPISNSLSNSVRTAVPSVSMVKAPAHNSQDSLPMDDVFDSQTFSDQYEDDLDHLIDMAERYDSVEQQTPSSRSGQTVQPFTGTSMAMSSKKTPFKSSQQTPSSNQESYQPLFSKNDKDDGCTGEFDGNNYPHTKDMLKVFKTIFGLRQFRTNQLQAINAALLGFDTFILMPTGGGKSLCYQLPALVTKGVSVVVSPLRALIQDQVQRLVSYGIPAAHLSSDVDVSQADMIYRQLCMKEPAVKLLYVTPEKLSASEKLLNTLTHLYSRKLLDRFVIDEAHCVSQWGHDFRPDYKRLNILRQKYAGVPTMALTATATPRVRKDIIHQLSMHNPKWFMQSFNRPNLRYRVLPKKAKSTIGDIVNMIQSVFRGECGIVYCLSRKDCDSSAQELRRAGIKAEAYHAGLKDKDRVAVQEKWLNGETCKVVCATIAFGMGIDKADVRFVIHFSMPKSVEGYYQEAGRAGRDGLLAHCILYYNYHDVTRLRRMIEMNADASYESKKVHMDNLYQMVRYCENQADCRRAQILQYFGENYFDRSQCNDFRGSICDTCDSQDSFETRDVTEDAKVIVKGVRDMTSGRGRRYTLLHIAEVFKGSQNNKVLSAGHDKSIIHGKGSAYAKQDVERFLRKLIVDGVLMEELVITAQDHAVCYVHAGKRANDLMQGKLKIELQIHSKKGGKVSKIGLETQTSKQKLTEECYKELVQHAKEIAKVYSVNNYATVFPNHMLREMAEELPLTDDEAQSRITGLTKHKYEKYSCESFLEITTKYLALISSLPDSTEAEINDDSTVDDWDSPYFNEPTQSSFRGKKKTGYKKRYYKKTGGKRGGRGGSSYGSQKSKGTSSFSKGNTGTSLNQFSYGNKSTRGKGGKTTGRSSASSSAGSRLGFMPVPQPKSRSFLGGTASFL